MKISLTDKINDYMKNLEKLIYDKNKKIQNIYKLITKNNKKKKKLKKKPKLPFLLKINFIYFIIVDILQSTH